jgi:hypothetical protein
MKFCATCKATYGDDVETCAKPSCAAVAGEAPLRALAGEGAEARYDLLERLDDRGAREVWRARDRVAQADVSCTILSGAAIADVKRVEGELRQLLRVRHASLASVLDCGRRADGRLFFVTELIAGAPLDRALAAGPLSLERARGIVDQVGRALLEVHKAGIIHRDLAPSNVIVTPEGAAKVVNVALPPSGASAHTSPEQAADRIVDRRANTYNLAAIYYHLVTGRPPLAAATADALLDERTGITIVPPSRRCSTNGLSAEHDRVIMRGLDKQPSARQSTLRAFLGEVEALAVVTPTAPPTPASVKTPAPPAPARPVLEAPLVPDRRPAARSMTVAGFATLSKLGHAESAERPVATPRAVAASATTLAKDDIAQIVRAAHRRAPEPEGVPAKAPLLAKDDIARMVSAAKGREIVVPAQTAPPVVVAAVPPAAAPEPVESPAADDPSLEAKKRLIEQMVRQARETTTGAQAMPAPAGPPPTPESVKRAAAKSEVAKPEIAKLEITKSELTKPTATHSGAPRPALTQAAAKPAVTKAPDPAQDLAAKAEANRAIDFIDAAYASHRSRKRRRALLGAALALVAIGATTAAMSLVGKTSRAGQAPSTAAADGAPTAGANPAEPSSPASPTPTAAAPHARADEPKRETGSGLRYGELVVDGKDEAAPKVDEPAPKADDEAWKEIVAKRVKKNLGAYLEGMGAPARASVPPRTPAQAANQSTGERIGAPASTPTRRE